MSNLGNKPIIVIISLIASIIAIVAFLSGKQSIREFIATPTLMTPNASEASTTLQPQSVITLADNFYDLNESYDKSLWECFNDCGSENVLLKDDALLLLQRGNDGYTSLRSRSKWMYSDLISLKGKMQISKNSSQGLGWLGIVDIVHCDINTGNNPQSPIIMCNSGRSANGTGAEYYTDVVSIQYGKWYQIEINFDHSSDTIEFYVDNNLIGEHKPISPLDAGQIELATASDDATGIEVYMDDIVVTAQK